MAMPRLTPDSMSNTGKKYWVYAGVFAAVLGAIALDTTIIQIGSDDDARQQEFSPDTYGRGEFPRIRNLVNDKAIEAADLVAALSEDKNTAVLEFATMAGAFPVFPVRFSGTVGEGTSGVFEIAVEGLPEGVKIRVQSGPAINGTELRDIPGDIEFGAFTNQIEYQDAGAGINRAMSAAVLDGVDREDLPGSVVSVVGVFKLINPKNWLVTPVEFDVQ